jgi:hypothetical protein
VCLLAWAFEPGPLGNLELVRIADSFGVEGLAALLGTLGMVDLLMTLAVAVAGGISLVVRFRRARGVERQQRKWFAFSGVVFCAVFAIGPVLWYLPESPGTEWIWTVLFLLGASTIPVAVGIAILHYRLYEIDLLSISIPDRELCLAGRCVPLPGDGSALACHVLGHLVLVGLRDQVNRYEGYGGHREYVEGY